MATIIDKTVFVGDIHLPKSQYDNIDTFVAKFEPIVLVYLLGEPLYRLMQNNAAQEPYKSLVEGSDYIVKVNNQELTIHYPGLANLIAYYVYCEYQRHNVTSTQSVGEVKSKQENSYNADVNLKVFSAWAKFEELYGYLGQSITSPSAYHYLYKNKELFPSWIFTDLKGSINSHDL